MHNIISTVFHIFSLCFLILWDQSFVEVPQLMKSVSSFMYRIVNRILRFVSRYVSNRGIVYRYTPTDQSNLVSVEYPCYLISLHVELMN